MSEHRTVFSLKRPTAGGGSPRLVKFANPNPAS